MFVNLTEVSEGVYDLPVVGSPFRPRAFVHGENQYPGNIFQFWNAADLRAIGKMAFTEVGFDSSNFHSTGFSDAIVNDIVVRTHTTSFAPISFLKDKKKKAVRANAMTVAQGGITIAGLSFSTDPVWVGRYNAIASAMSLGEPYPVRGIPVFTMDGQKIKATQAQFTALVRGIAVHLTQVANHQDTLEDAVDALVNEQDVIDFDHTTGWPANPDVKLQAMPYKGTDRRDGSQVTNAHIHHAIGHNTALVEKISNDLADHRKEEKIVHNKMDKRLDSLEGSRNRVRGAGSILAFLIALIGGNEFLG